MFLELSPTAPRKQNLTLANWPLSKQKKCPPQTSSSIFNMSIPRFKNYIWGLKSSKAQRWQAQHKNSSIFGTEKKIWKLRLWNYYAIKQLGMPFSPFPRISQIWLKSQTSSIRSNKWYVKEGNTESNRATNSPAGHEKGHVFPLKQILTALCYSLCGSFLRPIPVGPAESREYIHVPFLLY